MPQTTTADTEKMITEKILFPVLVLETLFNGGFVSNENDTVEEPQFFLLDKDKNKIVPIPFEKTNDKIFFRWLYSNVLVVTDSPTLLQMRVYITDTTWMSIAQHMTDAFERLVSFNNECHHIDIEQLCNNAMQEVRITTASYIAGSCPHPIIRRYKVFPSERHPQGPFAMTSVPHPGSNKEAEHMHWKEVVNTITGEE